MINWTGILAILSFALALASPFGIALALRGSKVQEDQKRDERVRGMYQEENNLLLARVKRLEIENKNLNNAIVLVIDILKKNKNIDLQIDEHTVTLRDGNGTLVSRLRKPDSGPLGAV